MYSEPHCKVTELISATKRSEHVLLKNSHKVECLQLYNLFPAIMRQVPGPHQKIFAHWKKVIAFIKIKIEEHSEGYDPSSPRDFIDCFVKEIEKVFYLVRFNTLISSL